MILLQEDYCLLTKKVIMNNFFPKKTEPSFLYWANIWVFTMFLKIGYASRTVLSQINMVPELIKSLQFSGKIDINHLNFVFGKFYEGKAWRLWYHMRRNCLINVLKEFFWNLNSSCESTHVCRHWIKVLMIVGHWAAFLTECSLRIEKALQSSHEWHILELK